MKVIKNFILFLYRTIKIFFSRGKKVLADEMEVINRIDICKSCPLINESKFEFLDRCGSCGCFIKSKTKFKHEMCPEFKW